MTEEKQEITPEQAREVLRVQTQANLQQCRLLVQAALDRFNAQLIAIQSVTPDGRIVARPAIVPREEP